MVICEDCGQDNPPGAVFCNRCGAVLAASGGEVRKTVTVLFCDVTGSTALGEQTDPEVLRELLARYFERMKSIVELHDGTVEKFIGDAVMAVFGIPIAHEDDAFRACRAAAEMQDALPELGIRGRIGVNTGEVVTGTSERLATGDAVNVAARFEQAAAPGEVLIGEATLALVAGAVVAESVEALALKGKSEPVQAFRLLSVLEAPERSHAAKFVGREPELAQIVAAWERVRSQPGCELLTVVGDAGVGKSRLAAEALAAVEAPVVRGRCLPYGEGITYWPVVEAVKRLAALPSDPVAAEAMRSLLGESDAGTTGDEIAWAFRKLLEERSPLVVVFDDIQWGEETFLDLVESTALLSAGAPILLLCMARPELLERRPGWPGPLRLEPLLAEQAMALIGDGVSGELRERIARAAGGNPLFISEMLAIAAGGDDVEVPPTLRALLTARLDQLDEPDRRVLECGAVEGEIFHRGAVQALAPEEVQLTTRLAGLVRRELIRPDRAQLAGDDGYRFRHLLMRDAAYNALPKAVRAALHCRFADWLESKDAFVEQDELAGYHLEQAARYEAELGRPDHGLALRAGQRLAAAGRRALDRGDDHAATSLLERALTLTRPLGLDVHTELDLAEALRDDPERAARVAESATARAGEAGDETAASLARAIAASYRLYVAECSPDELEPLLLEARRRLEQSEDHVGLARVWSALGYGVAMGRGCFDDLATASERALHHSRVAGRQGLVRPTAIAVGLCRGSRPADEALVTVERLLAETGGRAEVLLHRAWLLAMLDRFDEARRDAADADARLRELGATAWREWQLAEISSLEGDHEDASKRLRLVCDWLEATEQLPLLAEYLSYLGRSLCRLGRFDEAEELAERSRAIGEPMGEGGYSAPGDYLWRQVLARVHAHRGKPSEAERLARESVGRSERTDSLDDQCLALWDLAEVLAAAERRDEAEGALEAALDRCRRKNNLARARQLHERVVELWGPTRRAQ